jgi:hypothetical protein
MTEAKSTEWDIRFERSGASKLGECQLCSKRGEVGKRCKWCCRAKGIELGLCACWDMELGPIDGNCSDCGEDFKKPVEQGVCNSCYEREKKGSLCKDCKDEYFFFE